MTCANQSNLKSALKNIIAQDADKLRAYVATEALEYDDPQSFFIDLMAHGCISGMVSSLIYYSDTHEFFDTHYDAIETLRQDTEENIGEPLTIKGDMKNFLAWFAFEETAYQLALELGVIS